MSLCANKVSSDNVWEFSPYAEEIVMDHHLGFWWDNWNNDTHSAFVRQLWKGWNKLGQWILRTDLQKAYDSVRRSPVYPLKARVNCNMLSNSLCVISHTLLCIV
jgi:hypothetical protein